MASGTTIRTGLLDLSVTNRRPCTLLFEEGTTTTCVDCKDRRLYNSTKAVYESTSNRLNISIFVPHFDFKATVWLEVEVSQNNAVKIICEPPANPINISKCPSTTTQLSTTTATSTMTSTTIVATFLKTTTLATSNSLPFKSTNPPTTTTSREESTPGPEMTDFKGLYPAKEKTACTYLPLSLNNSCNRDDHIALRSLTRATSTQNYSQSACADLVRNNKIQLNFTAQAACCVHHPMDKSVTTYLPTKDIRVWCENAGFVDKCRNLGQEHCDLQGVTEDDVVQACDPLMSYLSVTYSCIPESQIIEPNSTPTTRSFPGGMATLLFPSTSNQHQQQCVVYSTECGSRISVGLLDLVSLDYKSCALYFNDGTNKKEYGCNEPGIYNLTTALFSTSSNHLIIRKQSDEPNTTIWLEVGVLPASNFSIICGPSANLSNISKCHSTTARFSTATSTKTTTTATTTLMKTTTFASIISPSPVADVTKFEGAWSVFEVQSQSACLSQLVSITAVCGMTETLALRSVDLGWKKDPICRENIHLAINTGEGKKNDCCIYSEGDEISPHHLPSKDLKSIPYGDLVAGCFTDRIHCFKNVYVTEMNMDVRNENIQNLKNNFLEINYSCIPESATVTFTGSNKVQNHAVSVIFNNQNSPTMTSFHCWLHSTLCYDQFLIGALYTSVTGACTLVFSEEGQSEKRINCDDPVLYQSWKGPFFNSSSNALNITLSVQSNSNQFVWLEVKGSYGGLITAACGSAIPDPNRLTCSTTASTTTTTRTTTTAATTTKTLVLDHGPPSTTEGQTNLSSGHKTIMTNENLSNDNFPLWGRIAAGVGGGVVLTVIITTTLLLCRRHRSRETVAKLKNNRPNSSAYLISDPERNEQSPDSRSSDPSRSFSSPLPRDTERPRSSDSEPYNKLREKDAGKEGDSSNPYAHSQQVFTLPKEDTTDETYDHMRGRAQKRVSDPYAQVVKQSERGSPKEQQYGENISAEQGQGVEKKNPLFSEDSVEEGLPYHGSPFPGDVTDGSTQQDHVPARRTSYSTVADMPLDDDYKLRHNASKAKPGVGRPTTSLSSGQGLKIHKNSWVLSESRKQRGPYAEVVTILDKVIAQEEDEEWRRQLTAYYKDVYQ